MADDSRIEIVKLRGPNMYALAFLPKKHVCPNFCCGLHEIVVKETFRENTRHSLIFKVSREQKNILKGAA